MKIFDAKYEKADLPAIIRENCSHLTANNREKLLSLLLKFESLFVVGHLELYRTHVLLYSTYVLLARPTKVRR